MRLRFRLAPGWEERPRGDGGVELRRGDERGLVVVVPPLAAVPEDIWSWSHAAAERDRPGGADEIAVTLREDRKTDLGWPIAVYGSEARAGGTVVEARVHAVYAMIEYGTIVAVRAASAAVLAAHDAELRALLESARPDWGHDPGASLRDLLAP